MPGPLLIAIVLALVIGIPILVALIVFVLVPVFRGIGWFFGRIFRFVFAEIADVFRLLGAKLTALVYLPLIVFNTVVGRWSRAQHYGRALEGELCAGLAAIFRMAVGHPARLFGAHALVDGVEKRLPQAIAAAPPGTSADLREHAEAAAGAGMQGRAGQFPGYQIIGTLAGGGSGGKLYVARPDAAKLSALARQGFGPVGDVVIKSFSLAHGSSLPQIVRENRALDAAKRLGLVLEHELSNERFFYVMRYVPGDSLGIVTPRLHAASGGAGLAPRELTSVIGYACDLLGTLHEYHRAGLWHKDVKPDNIIVSGGHAHLVDFGLVTPLRSSMTLTTHGTEYFRDPEMVRLALRGVKVHEVDGARFDIYGAGAVLYAMIENSFPAHGGLSQVTRPCPEALRWVVRRAMTDYDKRYPSAQAMLADLVTIAQAAQRGDVFSLRPADLPSVKNADESAASLVAVPVGPDGAAPHAPPAPPVGRWHGAPMSPAMAGAAAGSPAIDFLHAAGAGAGAARAPQSRLPGRSAADQVAAARGRAAEMRRRAAQRMTRTARVKTTANYGVAFATLTLVTLIAVGVGLSVFTLRQQEVPLPLAVFSDDGDVVIGPDGRVTINGLPADETAVFSDAVDEPEMPAPPPTPRAAESPRPMPVPVPAVAIARVETIVSTMRARVEAALAKHRLGNVESLGEGTRILVMAEPGALTEKFRDEVRRLTIGAEACGFEIIASEAPAEGEQGATADEFVHLAGTLRVAVGLKPLASADAKDAVQKWLSSHGEVQAIVWLSPDRDTPEGGLLKNVYTAEGVPERARLALAAIARAARRK